MALKLVLNPTTGKLDLVQNLSGYVKISDLTAYAKLDGSNQPFTDDIEVQGDGSASVTVNAVPAGQGGIDSYTKLMLHMDGANGSITITDSSLYPKTVTCVGNAQISTTSPKFGTGSLLLDGTGDWITIEDNDDFYFGTEDFTFDCWFNPATLTTNDTIFSQGTSNYMRFDIGTVSGSTVKPRFFSAVGGVNKAIYNTTTAVTLSGWNHIALCRQGSNLYIYLNGVSLAQTVTTPIGSNELGNFTGLFYIGNDPVNAGRDPNGKFDEIRISKGICRYPDGTTFTPPTEPYNQLVAYPQVILKGSGVQKAILKSDGSDSDKIKLLDKDNVTLIEVEQTTGKVGIGTTNPDRKLTVSDASGSAQIRLSYDTANYAEIRGGSTGSLYFTSSKGFTYFNAAGKDNKFYAFDYSSTGSPYLYLSAHSLMLNTGMVAGLGAVRLNDKGDSFLTGGNVGIGTTSPTAVLHLKAGTSTASTSPLKFTSGTLLGTAEVGAIEFLSDDFFATITTGAARKGIILDDGSRLTSGKIPVATTNGRLVDLTAQSTEADLKVDYTSGDLDTEAEVITAINTTNAKINSIIAKLKTLGLLATS